MNTLKVHCHHPKRREIAEPQRNVEDNRLIELRVWFCPDCGEKWETRQGLGDVAGITLSIELT